jgi:hypothetical protein
MTNFPKTLSQQNLTMERAKRAVVGDVHWMPLVGFPIIMYTMCIKKYFWKAFPSYY